MILLTGDTHRDFQRIWDFAEEMGTTQEDILIILGDAGINYYLDEDDLALKKELSHLPLTLLCVKGNHELHADEIASYEEVPWHRGMVYMEPDYPNLLFAKDGEIYDLEGARAVVIGGAYSMDRLARLSSGSPWFDTEQPSDTVKNYVEAQLEGVCWQVDYVLSHAVPKSYEPTHAFFPGMDQNMVDKSTEEWLDSIEKRLNYQRWFCGHYHCECSMGRVRILYEDFEEL